jgi:hypothetical protein
MENHGIGIVTIRNYEMRRTLALIMVLQIVLNLSLANEAREDMLGVDILEIVVRKQGTQTSPSNGLIVLRNDRLEFAVAPECFSKPNMMEDRITWQHCQMRNDGTYTAWTDFGHVGRGTTFASTMPTGGIYRIRIDINGTLLEYIRKNDDPRNLGSTKKGQPDSIGVCDTQKQIDIRNSALFYLGSTTYASAKAIPAQHGFSRIGKDRNKCNIFVAHLCCAAGASVPVLYHGGWGISDYPPVANDWATHSAVIAGWRWLAADVFPQPGYVAAHPVSQGPGHCGIVDYDGWWISAEGANVNRKSYFYKNGTSRCRRYHIEGL